MASAQKYAGGFEQYSGRIRIRSSAVIVEDNRILLVKQQTPTRNHPIWLPPGGELRLGETLKEAAIREVKEETGLIIKTGSLLAVQEFIESPFHAVEFYFSAETVSGSLATGTDPEIPVNAQHIISAEFHDVKFLKQKDVFPGFLANLVRNPDNGSFKHFIANNNRTV